MSEQSSQRIFRKAQIGANLIVLPLFLVFEVVHYAIYREWLAFSPRELWNEAIDP